MRGKFVHHSGVIRHGWLHGWWSHTWAYHSAESWRIGWIIFSVTCYNGRFTFQWPNFTRNL